ncbi:hypothetical protein [Pseudorhodoplanes sp.]|uniref:hypothetical protein n=1 Tax=Pseudorhodoplanes sp. TaxID=1934341 RepID=UPI00391BEE26
MAKLPNKKENEKSQKALEAYHLALGKVAHAWNHMQENLGVLFCEISGLADMMGMGIWHALKSDRTQRDLLEAALKTRASDEGFGQTFPKAKVDIEWLLKKVNALADSRNSAVHAPIFALPSEDGGSEILPFTLLQNPNAEKLSEKDILAEFEWYEGYFTALRKFAASMAVALAHERLGFVLGPWPERPLLPTVRQRSGHQDRNRQRIPQ